MGSHYKVRAVSAFNLSSNFPDFRLLSISKTGPRKVIVYLSYLSGNSLFTGNSGIQMDIFI